MHGADPSYITLFGLKSAHAAIVSPNNPMNTYTDGLQDSTGSVSRLESHNQPPLDLEIDLGQNKMAPPGNITPFAPGPPRKKQVISLGFYRTGSQSLKEALTILGYRDVFHSSAIVADMEQWRSLAEVTEANVPSLPSYAGGDYTTAADWDAYFGPCEALTDVTPFAVSLLAAYPDAKVVLVRPRPAQRPLARAAADGRAAWAMYAGMLGVGDLRKLRDRRVLRAGYERHHGLVRRLVPPGRLLEIDLADLGWGPLCAFLGKEVPPGDVPFPRLNESRVFRNEFRRLHRSMLAAALAMLCGYVGLPLLVLAGAVWYARTRV
ncbi:uncharacterized protein E0L32_009750 [Thyridium curvatum]|uniref:Uncharacterized protein n=1 Tax=Thyridium curvatum TaxID=1093900 RepID=A0A507AX05_9PEZI|nr:uncharacterized protein E0L32_009750 [Thyridium curvatum]TPX08810.1 hypothetical protein E0L32_009750 [Thyridium curvatum]